VRQLITTSSRRHHDVITTSSRRHHASSVPLQVQVGYFRRTIAKVQLGGSELAIVVSIVVCCVLLLLCTVGRL